MSKVLHCGDIVPGCEAVVRGDSDEAVMQQAVVHAREAHGIEEIDAATAQVVQAAIKSDS